MLGWMYLHEEGKLRRAAILVMQPATPAIQYDFLKSPIGDP